jgi:uncharacterized protein
MARANEVDIIRGLALLGICVVNVPFLAQPLDRILDRPGGIDLVVQLAVEWLFQGKFFVLFSFLFGWGLAIQMASSERAGVSGPARFRRRLLGLAVIGIAHAALVFFGDILVLYAFLGVPLLLLRAASPRALVYVASAAIAAGFCALLLLAASLPDLSSLSLGTANGHGYLGSFAESVRQRAADWPYAFFFILLFNGPVAFAAFCLGLAAAKVDFFRPGSLVYLAVRQRFPLLLAGGLALNLIYAFSVSGLLGEGLTAALAFASLAIGGPVLACAYLVIAVEMARRGLLRDSTAAAGRMSLTAYVLEGLLAGFVFNGYGIGLYGTVGAAGCLLIALGIFAATHFFAVLWLKRYARGPLEVVLRGITRFGEPKSASR